MSVLYRGNVNKEGVILRLVLFRRSVPWWFEPIMHFCRTPCWQEYVVEGVEGAVSGRMMGRDQGIYNPHT